MKLSKPGLALPGTAGIVWLFGEFRDTVLREGPAEPQAAQQRGLRMPQPPAVAFSGVENTAAPACDLLSSRPGERSRSRSRLPGCRVGAVLRMVLAFSLHREGFLGKPRHLSCSLVCSSSVLGQWKMPNETSKFPDVSSQIMWKRKKIHVCWLWEQELTNYFLSSKEATYNRARLTMRK